MASKLAGTCYIKVDGEQLELQGNLQFPLSKTTREVVTSTAGVVGYKEEVNPPYISGDFIVPKDFPIDKVFNSTGLTVTAECANGQVYTLSNAFATGDSDYKPIDGTVSIRFDGEDGDLA